MKRIDSLVVKYHQQIVGTLSLGIDGRCCTFEYDKQWLAVGFSISPLELPLKPGLFIAKPTPFHGNFGIFEDSLPDGYGRYLLHKALLKEGINDFGLSALDRLSLVGNEGMGALTYEPMTSIQMKEESLDFDLLQTKALEVLREQQDTDAELFCDSEGHWLVKFRHTYDPSDMGLQEYRYNELARQCGIHVPADLSVTGFDNIPEIYFYKPSLTTFHQDSNRLGAECVELLLEISGNWKNRKIQRILKPGFLIRRSCAPISNNKEKI